MGLGPGRSGGKGGVGFGAGTGNSPGTGGSGIGFGLRTGLKKSLGSQGGTKFGAHGRRGPELDRPPPVARRQLGPGRYRRQCKDPTCTGPGTSAATRPPRPWPAAVFGRRPDPRNQGPLPEDDLRRALLADAEPETLGRPLRRDKPEDAAMYAHGLATITLCEAYGLTHSKIIGKSAQQAVNFIQSAQNPATGGWRYTPGQEGDTSVVGWQVMALKSAQMAGLQVNPKAIEGAEALAQVVLQGQRRPVLLHARSRGHARR